ncbi:MAG: hypothetical protein Q8L34_03765 [Candidatus Woesearchaeota archaeon]|nr:hypothetical protein [Candidatus Woesearchaeota archaeon]
MHPQNPTQVLANQPLHRSSKLSLVMCVAMLGFFALGNAGVTNWSALGGAIAVSLAGMYASMLLRERASALDLRSIEASSTLLRAATLLPLLLFVAFLVLLVVQFW